MSCLVKIKAELRVLDAVQRAAQRLGGEFRHNQTTFRKWGAEGRCDHAIHFPACQYEVGLQKNQTGFEALFDADQYGGLATTIGQHGEKLSQAYLVEEHHLWGAEQGFTAREFQREDGAIVCELWGE